MPSLVDLVTRGPLLPRTLISTSSRTDTNNSSIRTVFRTIGRPILSISMAVALEGRLEANE
jgi:hypothetical protein